MPEQYSVEMLHSQLRIEEEAVLKRSVPYRNNNKRTDSPVMTCFPYRGYEFTLQRCRLVTGVDEIYAVRSIFSDERFDPLYLRRVSNWYATYVDIYELVREIDKGNVVARL